MESINTDNDKKVEVEVPTVEEIKERLKETIQRCGIKMKKEMTQNFLKNFKE
jgi:hypothetical protein